MKLSQPPNNGDIVKCNIKERYPYKHNFVGTVREYNSVTDQYLVESIGPFEGHSGGNHAVKPLLNGNGWWVSLEQMEVVQQIEPQQNAEYYEAITSVK